MGIRKYVNKIFSTDGLRWRKLDPNNAEEQGIVISAKGHKAKKAYKDNQFMVTVRALIDAVAIGVDASFMRKVNYDSNDDGIVNEADNAATADYATEAGNAATADLADLTTLATDAQGIVGMDAAGNTKYYGTDVAGTEGIYDLSLSNLSDTDITSATQGEVMVYNGTSGLWENSLETFGNVFKIGIPEDNQLVVWTGDGTAEGTASLTFDGDDLVVDGGVDAEDFNGVLLTTVGVGGKYLDDTGEYVDLDIEYVKGTGLDTEVMIFDANGNAVGFDTLKFDGVDLVACNRIISNQIASEKTSQIHRHFRKADFAGNRNFGRSSGNWLRL